MNWSLLACSLMVAFDVVPGCSGGHHGPLCNPAPEHAMTVRVWSPEGLHVDKVTAQQHSETRCEDSTCANCTPQFTCRYQGTGVYVVRAYGGGQTWTKKVDIEFDNSHCYVEFKEVDVTLTKATADK